MNDTETLNDRRKTHKLKLVKEGQTHETYQEITITFTKNRKEDHDRRNANKR